MFTIFAYRHFLLYLCKEIEKKQKYDTKRKIRTFTRHYKMCSMDCMCPTLYYARYDKCCGFPAATISNFVEVDTVLANDINIFVATTMYGLSLERATAGVVASER